MKTCDAPLSDISNLEVSGEDVLLGTDGKVIRLAAAFSGRCRERWLTPRHRPAAEDAGARP
jgi:hypothetical protein